MKNEILREVLQRTKDNLRYFQWDNNKQKDPLQRW